jgi:coenzyme F420 hydrogenase subunit beta
VTTALLAHLFQSGRIDAAYVVKTTQGPREAAGTLVRGSAELSEIHGSVYQPANFGEALQALLAGQDRFAFVGLPCEIAGLEMLKRQRPELAARHVMSIGLFCGGINRFSGVDYYLERFGQRLDGLRQIDFRFGPWPGTIRALTHDGEVRGIARIRGNSRWNILRYVVAFQGPWMLARCRLCPDQVADFADIAVGDPHLPRFRARGGQGFSAVLTRTPRGEALISAALAEGVIGEEPISRNEVVESQGYTLDNRRHVRAYQRVARVLGFITPNIRVYETLEGREAARHYRYAVVDMVKIALVRAGWLKPFYVPMQAMEYLFVTFAPSLAARRVMKLLKNTPD